MQMFEIPNLCMLQYFRPYIKQIHLITNPENEELLNLFQYSNEFYNRLFKKLATNILSHACKYLSEREHRAEYIKQLIDRLPIVVKIAVLNLNEECRSFYCSLFALIVMFRIQINFNLNKHNTRY